MSAPLLWGPNNTSNNLQNQLLMANGQLHAWNGQKNYISNSSFENQLTTGYSLGLTGTLTNGIPTGSPTFGSGTTSLALSIVTTNQIAGLASLAYTASAATTAGNMWASDPFTIDKEDQSQVLNFSVPFIAQSGTSTANWSGTSSSSFGVAIYDVTNSAWIIPQKPFCFIQGSGVGKATGTFQASATGTSYRLVVYNANATSGAITLYFDDIFVGPQINSSSSAVVSWNGTQSSQAVTANVTDIAFTTVKDSSAAWNGTQYVVPVAGDYLLAGAIGSTSGGATLETYVNGSVYTNSFFSTTGPSASGVGTVLITNRKPGDLISIRSNASITVNNSTLGIFQIGGASVGPAGQIVAASAHVNAGTSATGGSPINFDVVDFDTTGSVTTGASWNFKAPFTGDYFIASQAFSSGTSFNLNIFKNGSQNRTIGVSINTSGPCPGSSIVPLNAGDTITIVPSATATLAALAGSTVPATNYVSIFLLQGPSSQQANPTVAASYWMSSNKSVTANVTPLNFDSKDFDTTANVTTGASWQFLTQTSGVYQVSFLVTETVNSNFSIIIFKNGSALKAIGERLTNGPAQGTAIVNLNAGDIIYLVSDTNQTFSGNASQATGGTSYICINKVG